MPGSRTQVIGVDIDTYYVRGLDSSSEERLLGARHRLEAVLCLVEGMVAVSKPAYAIGDRDSAFATDQFGNSLPPSEDEVANQLLRHGQKPWLAYVGPTLLERLSESKIRRLKSWRVRSISSGILLVTRADPFR